MKPKTISFRDTVVIGAVNAAIVGIMNLALGVDHHPVFSEMWWCFFGSLNVYMGAKPHIIDQLWR